MATKYYMVFDGRAAYDIDAACVMETIGESPTREAAREYFVEDYSDMDAVLVEYDVDGDALDNPLVLGTVDQLETERYDC